MSFDSDRHSPRRRQMPAAFMVSRSAAELVRPLQSQLGAWHAGSIKLSTMAERLKAAGRTDPRLADEARALLATLLEQLRRFDALIGQQHPDIAGNDRVADTRRALEMIVARTRAVLALLGDGDRP